MNEEEEGKTTELQNYVSDPDQILISEDKNVSRWEDRRVLITHVIYRKQEVENITTKYVKYT